jgi:MoxR-like ATPase
MSHEITLSEAVLEQTGQEVKELKTAVQKVLVGQDHLVDRLVIALIAGGHVLLEGVPGLAKTTAVKTLGKVSGLSVSRLQFTPDMLPADVVGTEIYRPQKSEFAVKKGPVFANLVIADEINRAPAKVQSALLESMQEQQVTIGDQTFVLDQPFLVMATQNPIEQEGTYPLPEAQVDRFLFKVIVTYGTMEQEVEMMRRMARGAEPEAEVAADREKILRWKAHADQCFVSDRLRDYIVKLVFASRQPAEFGLRDFENAVAIGASPRASLNLERAAAVHALVRGRGYATPEDVKAIGVDVLRHRIALSYEAEADGLKVDDILKALFERVDVP